MAVIRIDCKTNEEWRRERAKSIGASAVGVLIGESPFMTPLELRDKMRAELNGDFDFEETLAMVRGHAYEQGVADMFAKLTGKKIIKASSSEYILRRDDIPFMHASPDRTYWIDPEGTRNESNKGILECKTTRRPVDAENVPLSWQFQIQVQMGIGGFKEGYIAWDQLSIADGFGYVRYEFDEDIFRAAVMKCEDFWNRCVIGEDFPESINVRDVVRRYPISEGGKYIKADASVKDLVRDVKEMVGVRKALDAEIDKKKEQIVLLFHDEEAIIDEEEDKALVTYKTSKGRVSIDSKKLKEGWPDVYQEVAKVGNSSRTLLVK